MAWIVANVCKSTVDITSLVAVELFFELSDLRELFVKSCVFDELYYYVKRILSCLKIYIDFLAIAS